MPPGMVGEQLYTDANNRDSALGAPPAPPTDTPPPSAPVHATQPVTTKHRMADENPDGTVRDTSTEALKPSNDLQFRNLNDEEQLARTEAAKEAATTPPAEVKPEAPPVEVKPVVEKVYAGKYKTVEELEKAYNEGNASATKLAQENARLKAEHAATPPQPPQPKSPEQVAAETAENTRILNEFVNNPKEYIEKNVIQRVTTALTAQQTAEQWRVANPDLAEHEVRVAFEATLLAHSDPEIARNPAALLNKATENFRAFTGKLRHEGKVEALTTETRVIPLLSNTAPAAATENPSPKAPLTSDDAFSLHMKMLKEQEQKSHRGLRR